MQCKNCDSLLTADQHYCNSCGAKVIRNRLTVKNLWEDFTNTFFNYDNRLLITIKHLFIQPESVIQGYVNGLRKRYINPISYYAISLTLTGLLYFLIGKFFMDQLSMSWLIGESGKVGEESFKNAIEYQSIISFISIPAYALISKLLFIKNKNFNLTEHVVIYLYLIGQFSIVSFPVFILSLLAGFNFFLVTYIITFILIGYVTYCLKRIFKLSWQSMTVKVILFLFILVFLLLLIGIIQIAIAYLTGGIEGIKAMSKPKT